jgi:ribulose 1,5-bisphosphate carboxylase large subunit-like protein
MSYDLTRNFVATYYIEAKPPLAEVAETIAEIESTGKWLGTGTPTALFERCRAQVGDIREAAPGQGEIDILFPLENIDWEFGAFPGLWLTMVGGGTHALLLYEKSRLLDFQLGEATLRHFPGPAFGQQGMRDLMGAKAGDLLIGTIVKPTAGLTPAEVADLCYETALGGVRFIKDDEKMLNPAYCPLEERVPLVVEKLKRAEDITGQRVIYAPHITTTPERLLHNAEIALKHGATALMVNFFAAGFNSLYTLRTQISRQVPIYAHCGGKEAFSRVPNQGIDPVAVAHFVRLLGGDCFRVSTVGGYLVGAEPEECRALANALTRPLPGIRPMMPAVSGGLNPVTLIPNLELFGADALMLAGTGITRHPLGPQAGTTALQQAAEAFHSGVSLEAYASTHEALRVALNV